MHHADCSIAPVKKLLLRSNKFPNRMFPAFRILIAITVSTYLLYMSPVHAAATTCGVGSACSSCQGNKVKTFQFRSGASTQVCCPGCRSQYLTYGYQGSNAFCNCNYDRVSGSAGKGEECSAPGMSVSFHLNGMPICCQRPMVAVRVGDGQDETYVFNCVTPSPTANGDCWRGSMCQACNQNFVGSRNGEALCCPNCEELGLIIGPGTHCSCNRNSQG